MEIEKTQRGNLVLVAEPSDAELLSDLKSRVGNDEELFMDELLESTGWAGNSVLMRVKPEDVGALTDSCILTDDRQIENDGTVRVLGNVYWFPNYMLESFVDTLMAKGRVVFTLAETISLGEAECAAGPNSLNL